MPTPEQWARLRVAVEELREAARQNIETSTASGRVHIATRRLASEALDIFDAHVKEEATTHREGSPFVTCAVCATLHLHAHLGEAIRAQLKAGEIKHHPDCPRERVPHPLDRDRGKGT